MKKLIFTLALIVSVLALSAQSYQVVTSDGRVVENGESFYIYGDGTATGGELNIEFGVTANENVRLIAEKVEENVVEGTMNFICWGTCLDPSVYVSAPVDLTPGAAPQVFSAHYLGDVNEVAGLEQIMTYYLYPANAVDDKFIIHVTFKYSLEGIDDNNSVDMFSNAYPVPASNVVNFDYNFPASVNNATIAIYNMMGQEVMRNEISGIQGKASLNVSDLADGVYFYSLIVNGEMAKSSKLIIKK